MRPSTDKDNQATTASVGTRTAVTLLVVGCSSSAGDPSSEGGAAGACEPSDGAVELTFTTWIPGIEEVVDVRNAANPDIQVTVQTGLTLPALAEGVDCSGGQAIYDVFAEASAQVPAGFTLESQSIPGAR